MTRHEVLYADTVDGRNAAPVDMENLPLFAGFMYTGFLQQYHSIYLGKLVCAPKPELRGFGVDSFTKARPRLRSSF